jgi:hypothetical protein
MKAISIKNPYANLIICGFKPLEIRSRPTKYRGDVLICASKNEVPWYQMYNPKCFVEFATTHNLYYNSGNAIGIVTIADCRPMCKEDEASAFLEYKPGLWAYVLENPRRIKPFDVCGNLGFFNVDYGKTCCICGNTIMPGEGFYNYPNRPTCCTCGDKINDTPLLLDLLIK